MGGGGGEGGPIFNQSKVSTITKPKHQQNADVVTSVATVQGSLPIWGSGWRLNHIKYLIMACGFA